VRFAGSAVCGGGFEANPPQEPPQEIQERMSREMSDKTRREALYDMPCTCPKCKACKGRGEFVINPMDDLFRDSETCEACDGTGTTGLCSRCQELLDMEIDAEEDLYREGQAIGIN